eukprot:scaffold1954_cov268-Pinguiococcus_pyrenoidosus.AAC.130
MQRPHLILHVPQRQRQHLHSLVDARQLAADLHEVGIVAVDQLVEAVLQLFHVCPQAVLEDVQGDRRLPFPHEVPSGEIRLPKLVPIEADLLARHRRSLFRARHDSMSTLQLRIHPSLPSRSTTALESVRGLRANPSCGGERRRKPNVVREAESRGRLQTPGSQWCR